MVDDEDVLAPQQRQVRVPVDAAGEGGHHALRPDEALHGLLGGERYDPQSAGDPLTGEQGSGHERPG